MQGQIVFLSEIGMLLKSVNKLDTQTIKLSKAGSQKINRSKRNAT